MLGNVRKTFSKGFTLLEMLLVVFLIGLTAQMVAVTLPTSTELEGNPAMQAEQLMYIMREISEKAVMENRLIGLRINKNGYEFLILTKNSKKTTSELSLEAKLQHTFWDDLTWVTYSDENIATKRDFGEEVTVDLSVGGLSTDDKASEKLEQYNFTMDEHKANNKNTPQILFIHQVKLLLLD